MKSVLQNKARVVGSLSVMALLVAACGGGEHMKLPPSASGAPGSTGAMTGSKNKASAKAPEGPFYKSDILPIFQKDCTLCHAKGGALPDWTSYNVAFERRDRIFNRVVEKKDMPLGAMLSPREIDLISAWIKNGALEKSPDDLASADPVAAEPTPPAANPPAIEPPVVTPEVPVEQPSTPVPPSRGIANSSGTERRSASDPSASPSVPPSVAEPVKASEVVSYKKDIQPIFANRCTSCHTPTGFLPDWMDYQTASAMAEGIKTRVVVKKDMPMGFPMPDEERELVRKWVDGGALE